MKFFLLGMVISLLTSCSESQKDNKIPIDLKFEGEIGQYYDIDTATVTFKQQEGGAIAKIEYKSDIDVVLIKNDKPFKIEPSNYTYWSTTGLSSDPKTGEWCMCIDLRNEEYDHIEFYTGYASKLLQHFTNPGDTCHLTFDAKIHNICRKENTKDIEEYLVGKQKLNFILKGPLCEK